MLSCYRLVFLRAYMSGFFEIIPKRPSGIRTVQAAGKQDLQVLI